MLFKNVIIMLCLACMIYWFYVQSHSSKLSKQNAKPQEYMSQITITNYTESGVPKEILQAAYWEFLPNSGKSELIKPLVTIRKANGDVWYLSANKAIAWHKTISDKISQVDMLDGVTIERPNINNATPTKIETLSMQYLPNQEIISSSEFVSMKQPGLTISGYGMLCYINNNRIELHEKITTVFVPS